ncbi:MAG: DSD1 family PLP-dependent enzyme [Burkholderiaceae bacterium]|jgi:D-serine deaminase-like pyridoxal phosphate-dependent protein|nr:DSD1 family PLP-dependent enzyme [Burkholderiaceae bacterium]
MRPHLEAFTIPKLTRLQSLVGKQVNAIETPALVIDADALNRNMQRMVEFATKHRIRLRPHAKAHKSGDIAHLQLQAGAVGICVQTVGEAEALAARGVNDIFISNQVLCPSKLRRVAALANQMALRGGKLALAVDSALAVERLDKAMMLTPKPIDVLVEIDVGQNRCGMAPDDAMVALVKRIVARAAVMRFAGLHAYHGSAQHMRSVPERRTAIAFAASQVRHALALLRQEGIEAPLVTGAGTGSFSQETSSGVWDEIQPGSFIFMDADYARNERDPAQPLFEQSLFVKTQVISAHSHHVVIDAGTKSLALDCGPPLVHSLPGQSAMVYAAAGDEHGILRLAGSIGSQPLPEPGETVWLIPGHCDPTVNLYDVMFGVRGTLTDGVVQSLVWVDGRGY